MYVDNLRLLLLCLVAVDRVYVLVRVRFARPFTNCCAGLERMAEGLAAVTSGLDCEFWDCEFKHQTVT